MRKMILFLALGFYTVLYGQADSLRLSTYRGYGIELGVPTHWKIVQDYAKGVNVMFVNRDTIGKDSIFENIALAKERAPLHSLRSYCALSKANLRQQLLDFTLLTEDTQRIANYDSRWILATHRYAGCIYKIKAYYFLKNGYAYLFVLTTTPEEFKETEKLGDRVLETLRIVD